MAKMMLVFHGGLCCGMKTIFNMDKDPHGMEPELEALPPLKLANDQYGHDVASDLSFYRSAAPSETRVERLDRYLDFLDDNRPKGVVEIVLANSKIFGTAQVDNWRPILEERGFREVNNCLNSNSGNRIFIFHRNKE